MVWGGEKIYLGRGELIIFITSICAPQRGRDGMDCIGVGWMTQSINRSGHQLGACSRLNGCWAHWAQYLMANKGYYIGYSVFTCNIMFYICLCRRECLDGVGWVWMTTSKLGRYFQLGLGFAVGLAGLGNRCITVNEIHLHTSHPILWLTGGGNGFGMDIQVHLTLSYLG